MAVAGFDNIIESQYSVPRLTTVAPDHDQIADTALRFLAERIASGDKTGPGRDVTSSFVVLERESSMPPAGSDDTHASSASDAGRESGD